MALTINYYTSLFPLEAAEYILFENIEKKKKQLIV